MNAAFRRNVLLPGATVLMAVFAQPAVAQYQWRDANGSMVFSDQPPPASVKPTQVLRAVPMPVPPPAPVRAPQGPGATAGKGDGAADVAADRELARRQKAAGDAQRAEQERARTEQAQRVARACEEARGELRTLESGMRMARVNADGEREYLDDGQREQRIGALRRDLERTCQSGG